MRRTKDKKKKHPGGVGRQRETERGRERQKGGRPGDPKEGVMSKGGVAGSVSRTVGLSRCTEGGGPPFLSVCLSSHDELAANRPSNVRSFPVSPRAPHSHPHSDAPSTTSDASRQPSPTARLPDSRQLAQSLFSKNASPCSSLVVGLCPRRWSLASLPSAYHPSPACRPSVPSFLSSLPPSHSA